MRGIQLILDLIFTFRVEVLILLLKVIISMMEVYLPNPVLFFQTLLFETMCLEIVPLAVF